MPRIARLEAYPAMLRMHFSLADIGLRVDCAEARAETEIRTILENFGLTARESHDMECDAFLRIGLSEAASTFPADARFVREQYGIRIFRTGDRVYLRTDRDVCSLDPGSGKAELSLHPASADQIRRDLVLHCLLLLLRYRGLHAIHAACVETAGLGCLIVGTGGSGKSTLALSLVRKGWNFLSDDVIFLCRSADRVEAVAVRTDLLISRRAARHYPDIRGRMESLPSTSDSKLRLDVAAMHPDRVSGGCVPRMLLFPRIVDSPESCLAPVSRADALVSLAAQSALVLAEPDRAGEHLELLKDLVNQCRPQVLHAGRDLEADPSLIAALVPVPCPEGACA